MSSEIRMRQTGWIALLVLAIAAFIALTFKVNAARGEVRMLERQIVAMEQEKLLLETEFQTRASQHQLATWNAVEFGYVSPRGDQFIDSETQLAMLGMPRHEGAPTPIRLASADTREEPDGFDRLAGAFDVLSLDESRTGLQSAGNLMQVSLERDRPRPMADASTAGRIAQRLTTSVRLSGPLARAGE